MVSAAQSVKTVSVLVIDDNHDIADSLALFLRLHGHDAEAGYDGDAAVQMIEDGCYEVVFCDLGMPGRSGFEVAQHVSRLPGPRPVMVAVSAYSSPAAVRAGQLAGFDAHFRKPVNPETLEKVLQRYAEWRDGPHDSEFVPA